MLIRIDTIVGNAVIVGGDVRTAKAVARSYIKATAGLWGGGPTAKVSVATPGGAWHSVGRVGNR